MSTKKRIIRLLAFLLAAVLLVCFANTHLIQTDTITCLTMKELTSRSDIELCFVGSSVVRDHFNPALITAQTGKNAFCAAVTSASLQASLAITEELFLHNSPEWVVLVVEPYTFNTAREYTEAAYKLMPFLTSPAILLRYYLRACREDGYYVDRLFPFREIGVTSLADFAKTLGLRYNTAATYEKLKETMDPTVEYMGAGFLRNTPAENAEALVRQQMAGRAEENYITELLPASREMLLEYKALCEQNGANLMVIISPNLTAHALAEPDFLTYTELAMDYCESIGIPCFNFAYARPEFIPRLDGYYFDLYHMSGEGADILSEAFARFFTLYTAGEDVSGLFYPDKWTYLDAIDYITNTWLTPDGQPDSFTADCLTGLLVTPEYRFVLRAPDGTETLLRDYGADASITVQIPEGCDLRVYARPQGSGDAPVYYDYPTDYDAYPH